MLASTAILPIKQNSSVLMNDQIFLIVLCFLYFERERASRGGAEREGDTESEAGSRLQAVSTEPHAGLELTNHEMRT